MKLIDIFEDDENYSFFDLSNDDYDLAKMKDTRKPRLTLYHLNKLKKIRAVRWHDNKKDKVVLRAMYGLPPAEGVNTEF